MPQLGEALAFVGLVLAALGYFVVIRARRSRHDRAAAEELAAHRSLTMRRLRHLRRHDEP